MSDVALDQVAIRVKNVGVTAFDGPQAKYGNVQYSILPGQERFVPYQAVVLWFGNPYSKDDPSQPDNRDRQLRTLERERLSVNYGVYSEAWVERYPGEATPEDIDEKKRVVGGEAYVLGRHPNLPLVECWITDPDGDKRLWTVIEDPEGVEIGGVNTPRRADDSAAIEKHLKALEAQVAKMQTQLAIAQPEVADEVDLDSPEANETATPDSPEASAPSELDDPQPEPGSGAIADTPTGARSPRKKAARVG